MENCIFCGKEVFNAKILENDLAFCVYDKYPDTKGHMLIIPKRHSTNWFKTTDEERIAMHKLLDEAKKYLDNKYNPTGYNILLNCEKSAGQVIFHTHMHLLPRYGEVTNK